jgi:PmbA protein
MISSSAALLESLIEATLKAGADAVDARISESASLSVEVRNGDLETVEREESRGIALRALVGRRQATVSATDLSPDALKALSERVVAMARLAPEDKFCGIAEASEIAHHHPDLKLETDDLPEADELERRGREMEAAAMAIPGVKQMSHCGASWNTGQTWLAASNGFRARKSSGMSSMAAVAIAERDGAMERDYESSSERRRDRHKTPEWIGREAGTRAVSRLGARKVDSQTAAVIYDHKLSSRLIGALIGAISGPAVARGVSFLKDKLGKQVFAPGVNLIDDPLRETGFGSRAFDGEGRPVKRTALVEDGVLTQWLLNGPSARQLGLAPNGFSSTAFGSTWRHHLQSRPPAGHADPRPADGRRRQGVADHRHVRPFAQPQHRRLFRRRLRLLVREWRACLSRVRSDRGWRHSVYAPPRNSRLRSRNPRVDQRPKPPDRRDESCRTLAILSPISR